MFDGVGHAGVVPYFFAPNIQAALETVGGDPAFAHGVVKKLNDLLRHMQHVSHLTAIGFLLNGQPLPVADAPQAFQSVYIGPARTATKRTFQTANDSESGRRKYNYIL